MAIIDVVKYQGEENNFAWKFPSEDLRIGTQVVVNFSQKAFFVKDGKVYDEFTNGTHTILSNNIPLLNKIVNLPFGNESPFQAEVWYVNLLSKLDNKWGTTAPILLEDTKYGIVLPVRAFGQYGFKISDARAFLEKLVGNLESFSSNKIQDFFKGKIISTLTSVISEKFVSDKISILEINTHLNELSDVCKERITEELQKFGVELVNFYFLSINVPDNDPSILKFKEAKDLTAKINITGKELYKMDRSFDVLEKAAMNEGGMAGNLMGAGLGLGIGTNLGNQMTDVSRVLNLGNTPPPIPPKFYAIINDEQTEPRNKWEFEILIKEGTIQKNTLVWSEGMDEWQPIYQLDEFKKYFTSQENR